MAVNDMDLAGLSLCSLCPRPASRWKADRLGYSVIGFAVFINRFARGVDRTLTTSGFHGKCCGCGGGCRVLRVATISRRSPALSGREVCAVMEIAVRVIQPRIAHGDRRSDIGGTDDDLIAIDLCDSGFPLVVGTGDLSELGLGWCTYGVGDHMSHYNPNGSVSKTLIQHLIRWVISSRHRLRRRAGVAGYAASPSSARARKPAACWVLSHMSKLWGGR